MVFVSPAGAGDGSGNGRRDRGSQKPRAEASSPNMPTEGISPTLTEREVVAVMAETRPMLVRYFAAWTGDEAGAEDYAQETLLYVHTSLSRLRFPTPEALRAYIFKNACGKRMDHHRRANRRTFVPLSELGPSDELDGSMESDLDDFSEGFVPVENSTPEARAELRQEEMLVLSVIPTLPGRQSKVLATIVRREVEGDGENGPTSTSDRVSLHRARAALEHRCRTGRWRPCVATRPLARRSIRRTRPSPTR